MADLQALIFDVDGTLAETEEAHRLAFNQSFRERGLPWSWNVALYRELLAVTGGRERIRHFIASREPQGGAAKLLPDLSGVTVDGLRAWFESPDRDV